MSAALKKSPLRVVTNNDVPTPTRWQGDDDVLFHRRQIKRGVRLIYSGRTNHGDVYVVDEIRSHRLSKRRDANGQRKAIEYGVDSPVHLSDWVVLKRLGSNQWRTVQFQYLSYSAVWRIAPS